VVRYEQRTQKIYRYEELLVGEMHYFKTWVFISLSDQLLGAGND
jgi:hypothetical protein